MPKDKYSITVTEFKAKCLEILREVQEEQVTYLITKHNKVVAEVGPSNPETSSYSLKNSIIYETDLISPIDEDWEGDV
jgi:antitoxin (DNA-binding transcriptional repressor) of toxin-antitoxin stability system